MAQRAGRAAARVALALLALGPPAAAFTNTMTSVGVETDVVTRTVGGQVETLTSIYGYTSYVIYMNDGGPMSSFAGIPATRTKDGVTSTFLSRVNFGDLPDNNALGPGPDPPPTHTSMHTPSKTDDKGTSATADKSTHSTSETESGEPSKGRSTSIGPIIGGVVGGVLALVILGAVGWFFKRKLDRKKQLEEHHREEMQMLAMELDGSFKPGKGPIDSGGNGGQGSDSSRLVDPRADDSIADDLVSRYTGGTLSRNPPTLLETYSFAAHSIGVGAELTMDSQGRMGMPDGSPAVLDLIMPLRNSKVANYYVDLEWFPLASSDQELMQHQGPSYIEEKALYNVANYIKKGSAPPSRGARRP
ncbi:hypothetical protein H4R18_005286 [Coemansia javaensis]|uniref:Uncharacterized protein n=1 Tax=Coemansia javaensis TaxID=2761396 RepID=A0A9W8LF21_9FUNG|nr:hypothetical protein H4R18_005286 [Coemansia javaensis]